MVVFCGTLIPSRHGPDCPPVAVIVGDVVDLFLSTGYVFFPEIVPSIQC